MTVGKKGKSRTQLELLKWKSLQKWGRRKVIKMQKKQKNECLTLKFRAVEWLFAKAGTVRKPLGSFEKMMSENLEQI